MLMVNGRNIAASVGPDGILLVNTGTGEMAEEIFETITGIAAGIAGPKPNECFGMSCANTPSGWTSPYMNAAIASPAPPRPLRYIFNTNAAPHNVGGNVHLSLAGEGEDGPARITAHENALFAMSGPEDDPWSTDSAAWPAETFYSDIHKLTSYYNGEGVVAYSEPGATTDGDSIIHFRQSEVIVAGDVYSTISYPRFDLERGGSVQGVLDTLNHIIDLAVPEYRSQGGTWVIPGRGRLSDTADVTSYRNMVQIVVDRIEYLIDEGMSLAEIQSARPTLDFDPRYGTIDGEWTPEMFVEAVYRSLTEL
jgi:glyoxylase-like metal-dependent hydrolase (beta-lactamase superfamily II)